MHLAVYAMHLGVSVGTPRQNQTTKWKLGLEENLRKEM